MKNLKLQFFRTQFLVSFLLISGHLFAQELYYDVNPSKEGSNLQFLQSGNSAFVFLANGAQTGYEVFKSDGTSSGTVLFEDQGVGAANGTTLHISVIDDDVYLVTNSGNTVSYWKHNLNSATPELLTSVTSNIGAAGYAENFKKAGGYVFFFLRNPGAVFELWKTDGTPGNTTFVKELGVNAFPDNFRVLNDILYFFSDDGIHGRELWRSDGTANGTYLVKDASTFTYGYVVKSLTVFQNKLYYTVIQPQFKFEMWVSDGTEAGTSLFLDNYPDEITKAGDNLFFLASDPAAGSELWKYDGINAPAMVKDIEPGSNGILAGALTPGDDKLYFYVKNADGERELWTSNGTPSGTFLLKDIDPWPNGISFTPITGININETFYFVAGDETHGTELWKTDGTPSGTVLVSDVYPGERSSMPANLIEFGGKLYFGANDGLSGRELFVSDGTATGTQMVIALNPTGASSIPLGMKVLGNQMLFIARTPDEGTELWTTDGVASNTQLVSDIFQGPNDSNPFLMAQLNQNLFFTADHPDYGQEIWKTDGTTGGTTILKNIGAGNFGSSAKRIVALDDKIVFGAFTPDEGEEPWVSDGTENGTQLLKDLNPGFDQSLPSYSPHAFVFNGKKNAIFEALSGNNQLATLYKTDGTEAGTTALTSAYPSGAFYVLDMIQINNYVLFSNFSSSSGQLWRTDGTQAGTELVKQFFGYGVGTFAKLKNAAYFLASNNTGGRALWKTDGTTAGTEMVYDFTPSGGDVSIFEIQNVNDNYLFFSLYTNNDNDFELWVTDGTTAGTHLVKDINPNFNGSSPRYLTPLYNNLYFSADDGVNGREIWVSDGSENGTYMLKDIWEGPASGDPEPITVFKDHIYFGANDGIHGKELWRFPEGDSGTSQADAAPAVDIYPNPADQSCVLKFEKEGQWLVNLINFQGVTVARQTITGKTGKLNTAQLPTGMYLINGVDMADQKNLTSGRLMVTHK